MYSLWNPLGFAGYHAFDATGKRIGANRGERSPATRRSQQSIPYLHRLVLNTSHDNAFPVVSEFGTTEEAEAYDRWFRAEVQASLDDPRPSIPHDQAMARIRATIEAAKPTRKRA